MQSGTALPRGSPRAAPSRALTSAAARPGHSRASSSSSARRCGQPLPAILLLAWRPAELSPAPELCPRPARGFWPRGCRLAPSSALPAPWGGDRDSASRGGAVRAAPLPPSLPPPPRVSCLGHCWQPSSVRPERAQRERGARGFPSWN